MRRLLSIVFLLCCTQVHSMAHKVDFQTAVERAIQRYGVKTEPELKSYFSRAKVAYPPRDIALLAFKKEQRLELWAKNQNQKWRFIHTYRITANSGRLGPKLKERDRQIPEGIYRVTSLNPFSVFHLSMMINYPNDFDRLQAIKDGRNQLGGNIFIHGKAKSVGCLAIGDAAIEQLFYLTHLIGLSHVKLIIAPNDLRKEKAATSFFAQPRWLDELYRNINEALIPFSTRHLFALNQKKGAI